MCVGRFLGSGEWVDWEGYGHDTVHAGDGRMHRSIYSHVDGRRDVEEGVRARMGGVGDEGALRADSWCILIMLVSATLTKFFVI